MKKYLPFALLFLILFLVVINKHLNPAQNDRELAQLGYQQGDLSQIDINIINTIKEHMIPKTFFQAITEYSTFQIEYLEQYYTCYQQGNSLIESLNIVNHPDFLKIKNATLPAIAPKEIILVNQVYALSPDYKPAGLVPLTNLAQVQRPNETMTLNYAVYHSYFDLTKTLTELGLELIIYSAYRSYEKQVELWVNGADAYLAKPGHSEHQTGLALDVATLTSGLTTLFAETDVYHFLHNHAHEYGFIIRYPLGKENITGYAYEPWHLRYVGINAASIIFQENLTLEEYLYKYEIIPLA